MKTHIFEIQKIDIEIATYKDARRMCYELKHLLKEESFNEVVTKIEKRLTLLRTKKVKLMHFRLRLTLYPRVRLPKLNYLTK